jgi:hypothetical protein
VVYINVGKSINRKYRNEFWVEKGMGDGGRRDYDIGEDGDGNRNAVLMSWYSGTGTQGGIQSVAGILAAATATATAAATADETGEAGEAAGASGTGATETAATSKGKSETKTAVLFLRRHRLNPKP